ncbi:MAG: MFS transporter [Dinoroseobacter sp.]|nr:MFS transporter [Dinoroseobacter sp.]
MASMRKRVWGWMMFDWASQPYATLILTFIFAPYFTTVVGDPVQAQIMWGYAMSVSGVIIACLAPVLGAVADGTNRRRPWIGLFSLFYVVGATGLWIAVPGADNVVLILVFFGIGLIGMEFATIFTNAMLPDLGPRREIGRISGTGGAVGYAGGVVSLLIMLLFLAENDAGVTLLGNPPALGLDPETYQGTRSVGPFVAIWFVVFMIPFAIWVTETAARKRPDVRKSLGELWGTIKGLPSRPSLFAFLGASMLYRDALSAFYVFGGIYARGVLEWSIVSIGVFGIIAAIAAAIASWLGGFADRAFGPKPVIASCIAVLTLVGIAVVMISRESVFGIAVSPESALPDIAFYICGSLIGAAGGILHAASRTMMVHQAHPERMTEAFGLYALAGKATAFVAPFLITVVTEATGSQRAGLLPLIVLFLCGLFLLRWVQSDKEASRQ